MNNIVKNTAILLLANTLWKNYEGFEIKKYGLNEDKIYLDFVTSEKISINDFKAIEKNMKKLVSSGSKITALNSRSQTVVKINDFETKFDLEFDETFKSIKFFKLLQIGGTEENYIRIHFCAFDNELEYKNYLSYLEEMEQRDHRKIGKELSIFCFSENIGQGLPLFLPNGAFIKDKISRYLKDVCFDHGFQITSTPVLGMKNLYVTSGHWDLYKENNFPPITFDEETYMLRPMTCPHHMMVFKNEPKSYKDLPYTLFEDSILHRYESSGGLIGLERVRSMELFDTHIFLRESQIEDVFFELYSMIIKVYEKLEIKIDRIDLSLRSEEKDKFFNDDKMWNHSEKKLRDALNKLKLNYIEVKGEAAFYGPKVDFQYKTTHGKFITISTIQLDFLLPRKFELEYKNEKGESEIPTVIHFGLIGTYERFISCLLSQTKGVLPLWLAFKQVTIIPVNNEAHLEYSKKVNEHLKNNNIRTILDDSNERLAKKIRSAQVNKIHYQIIIGDDEIKNNTISYRKYGQKDTSSVLIEDFIKFFV